MKKSILLMMGTIVLGSAHAAAQGLSYSHPMLYYSFDDGTPTDLSGNENHGIVTNATSVDGVKYAAMQFNGSNTQIAVPNSDSLNVGTGDFSISTWVKIKPNTRGKIFDKKAGTAGVGYSLEIWGTVPLLQVVDAEKGFFNYYPRSGVVVNDDQWHHLAATVDRDSTTGVKLYVDGILVAEQNALYRTGSFSNTSDMFIGRKMDGSQRLNGIVDELRIYERVISEAEIDNLYLDFYKAAEWTWDDQNVGDTSGNGNSINSSHISITGVVGNARYFNGVDSSKVTIPDHPSLDFDGDNFSVSFWIKKIVRGYNREAIIRKGTPSAGFMVQLISDTDLEIQISSTTNRYGYVAFSLTPELLDEQWHHIVITKDSTLIKFYCDGILKDRSAGFPEIPWSFANDENVIIGGLGVPSTKSFIGFLDEVAMYNIALSEEQVADLFGSY